MTSSKKAMMTPTLNTLVLGELAIPYVVQRKRKHHLSFRFLNTTLMVSAPLQATDAEIEAGLRTKANWIRKHYTAKRAQALPPNQIRLLGQVVTIETMTGPNHHIEWDDQNLRIVHRANQSAKAAINQALTGIAETEITAIFQAACQTTGLQPKRLTFKNLRSSLGRCSSKRHIVLARRLIHYPREIILAVCYHELAHLTHMNHSSRFYALLENWMPDYRHVMKNARTLPSVSGVD
jgi:predicted metal-dependent hydrolase